MRKLVYLLIFALFAAATLMKAKKIEHEQKQDIVSITSQWEKNGKPVYVHKVSKDRGYCITRVSGKYSGGMIRSYVTLEDYYKLKEGQPFTASTVGGPEFRGHVAGVAGSRDLLTGMYGVRLKVDSGPRPDEGDIAVADVRTRTLYGIMKLPSASLLKDKGRYYCWVIEDGAAHNKYVKTGIRCDGYIQVVSGITPGDTVCTRGMSSLEDGDKVDVIGDGETPL